MSQAQVVDDFIQKIEWLHEVEYGDFKRKLSLYIDRLEQSIPPTESTAKVIYDMREKIIYNPEPDIDLARMRALEAANKLKNLV